MIPAPVGFRDLRAYLHHRRIDAAWIRTVLDAYLGEYDHQQTDGELDLDHQVWAYRQIITDFKQLIEEDVETDDDHDDSGADPAVGVGDQAAGHAAESRPSPTRAAGAASRAAKSAEKPGKSGSRSS